MAKNKRFPSDANKSKNAAKKVEVTPEKTVEGKAVPLVQVEYKKENHHLLDHVYALRKGVNHIPADVWAKAAEHPTTKQLIKDGHLVGPAGAADEEEEEGDEDVDPSKDSDGEGSTEKSESDEK